MSPQKVVMCVYVCVFIRNIGMKPQLYSLLP